MVYNSNSRGRFHHSSSFRGRGGNNRFAPYGRDSTNSRFPPPQPMVPDNFEQSPSELQFPRPPQPPSNHQRHDRRQGRNYHERGNANGDFYYDTTAGDIHIAGSSRGRNKFHRNFRGRGSGGGSSGRNSPPATSFPDHTNSNFVQLGDSRSSSLSRKWGTMSVSHNRSQHEKPPFERGYTSPTIYQQQHPTRDARQFNQRYQRPSMDNGSSGLGFDPQDCDPKAPGIYHSTIPSAPMNGCMRRSLFLRTSYKNHMDSRKIEDYFSEFGSVAEVLNFTSKNGVCYVVYFDWRDAQNAFDLVDKIVVIGGQRAEVMPSKLRPDAQGRSPYKNDHQATVLLSLVGCSHSEGFTDSGKSQLESYGELADFYQAGSTEWVAEFYDIRAAKEAAMTCHGMILNGGAVYTTFLWDGSVPKIETRSRGSSSHVSRSRSGSSRHHLYHHHQRRHHDHSQNEKNDGGVKMDDAIQRMANDPEVMRQAFAARDLLFSLPKQQPEPSSATANGKEGEPLPPLPTPTSLAVLAKSAEQAMSVSTSKENSHMEAERSESNGQLLTPSTSVIVPETSTSKKPVQAPVTASHTDGINHLLGILAQVQKSSTTGESNNKK